MDHSVERSGLLIATAEACMAGKMNRKVLIIAPAIPFPIRDGGMLRHCQLIRASSSRFTCDLVALAEADCYPDEEQRDYIRKELDLRRLELVARRKIPKALLAIIGLLTARPLGLWLYHSRHLATLLARFSREETYDSCLLLGDVGMAQYAQYVVARRKIWDICDDPVQSYHRRAAIITGTFMKWYYELQAQVIGAYVRKVAPDFDSILVIAENDGSSLRKLISNPLIEVPNSVDTVRFHSGPSVNGHGREILFTGAVRSWANREAVRFFVQQVLPLLPNRHGKVTFHVVGDGFDRFRLEDTSNVVLTGFVTDLTTYYNSCDVFVCPLMNGTGVKNKVLEAMACGCAVVTTAVGAEGLRVTDGRELLIAETAKDFVSALERLFNDPRLRENLGTNAQRFVEHGFSRERTENALARVLAF